MIKFPDQASKGTLGVCLIPFRWTAWDLAWTVIWRGQLSWPADICRSVFDLKRGPSNFCISFRSSQHALSAVIRKHRAHRPEASLPFRPPHAPLSLSVSLSTWASASGFFGPDLQLSPFETPSSSLLISFPLLCDFPISHSFPSPTPFIYPLFP